MTAAVAIDGTQEMSLGSIPQRVEKTRILARFTAAIPVLLMCAGTVMAQIPSVSLMAKDAGIGGGAHYYADGDFIGSWTDPGARIQWDLTVAQDAVPQVELVYGCAPGCGGKFQLEIAGQKLTGEIGSTGGWYNYQTMELGTVRLPKGRYTVTLQAGPFQTAAMNLKQIRLAPLQGSATTYIPPRPPGPLPPTYLVPNFHPASCGWLDNWSVERNYCANDYLSHLDRVRDDPGYRFALSECDNQIAILNFKPDRFEELKRRVREGRVELVNAFFLEPTINLSGGEALAQMGIQGLRWQQQVMGVRPRFCWAIDTCGVHDQMPQICAGLELDALVYTRCSRADKSVFWSQSPDGSRILTLVPDNYSDFSPIFDTQDPLTLRQLADLEWNIAGKAKRTPVGAPVLVLGGSGDYSLAPARQEYPAGFLQQWNAFSPNAPFHFATLSDYFNVLQPGVQSGRIALPTIQGGTSYDFQSFWIQNPEVKSWYRRDEHALQSAEMLATVASLKAAYGYPVQTLYDAWLQMLLNMDRNTLWGAAAGMVFHDETSWDAQDRFQWVQDHSAAVLKAAAQKLSGPGSSVTLFNAANWRRTDPQRLHLPPGKSLAGAACEQTADGSALVSLPLPAAGVVGVRVENRPPTAPKRIDLPRSIETDFYSARVDPETGALVSLRLKPSGEEMLGGPANVLVAERHVGGGDPGDFTAPRPQRPRLGSSSDTRPEIQVTEGPVAITVTARAPFYGGGASVRTMRFYKHSQRIDFETDLNDIPNLTVVVAEFPLAASPTRIRCGIPFGFSDGAGSTPDPNLHGWTQGITPAVEWSDYTLPGGGGVALLDRGLPGREIDGQTPIIYLYNATDQYYGYPNSWLSGKGPHHFEYALVAHGAGWLHARVPQMAWEYNCPIVAAPGCAMSRARSFVRTSDNLMLEAMRRDGADVELRLVECLGQAGTGEVTLDLPHGEAAMTDLVGGHRQVLDGGPTYRFPVRPQQIVTLRFRTAVAVRVAPPRTEWDDLVPPSKLASLHRYLPDVRGHPPSGG